MSVTRDLARRLSAETYSRRRAAAAEVATHNRLHGFVLAPGPDWEYFLGTEHSSHERLSALVITADGTCHIVTPQVDVSALSHLQAEDSSLTISGWVDGGNPYQDVVDTLTTAASINDASELTIGVGASFTADHVLAFQGLLGGLSRATVLASPLLAELTAVKDEEEKQQLRAAALAIDEVHEQVPAILQPGMTEAEVAQRLEELILSSHDSIDFSIVGSGPNGANPHHGVSDRVIDAGEVVVVDIGGKVGAGYRSDCTRNFVCGGTKALSERYSRDDIAEITTIYDVLFEAQAAACAAVKPGVTAGAIDAVAREVITAAGYGEYFVHRTGHGIGLSTHEEPFIAPNNDVVLREGMAFSIEPGIYIPGRFGFRIEDIVLVTADGVEILNKTTKKLI